MIRFVFRLLAMIALAIAVIMAVLDATRTLAAGLLVMTPLGQSWLSVSPDTLEAAQSWVQTHAGLVLWDTMALAVLALPGFAVFGVVALILYAIGRRPERRIGHFVAET